MRKRLEQIARYDGGHRAMLEVKTGPHECKSCPAFLRRGPEVTSSISASAIRAYSESFALVSRTARGMVAGLT